MGRIAYTADGQGIDHEGYVAAELDIPPIYNEGGRGDFWTSTSCQEHDGHETGRHRAACGCGWRGPIITTGAQDVFLPEAQETEILKAWDDHVAPLLARLEGTAGLAEAIDDWQKATGEMHDALAAARRNGVTWEQIGGLFGISRQAAWERFKAVAD